jgi:glycosyltransferase involved in cell wall biosynthesis
LNVRLAWFSPLPPSTSGIAAYSAEILPLLTARGCEIDAFDEQTAHEFVWRHRRHPYDLTIFQMGNAACHDFMWAYLFHYPGLVVLHDLQLHQARALFLTKRWEPRVEDYIAEVHANHPDAPEHLPYLVLARMGDRMYQHWPLIRLVIEAARVIVVHNSWVAGELRTKHPTTTVHTIEMGVSGARPQTPGLSDAGLKEQVLLRHQIPGDAVVVGAFGGVTPEKRIPQLLRAIAALAPRHPNVHLLLVGATAEHYDVRKDAEASGIGERVHVTGFVADEDLPTHLHAADICACLRWPTNRETSASWLRCLAAGQATMITELAHLGDVPTLDPRGWRVLDTSRQTREPVAVSIDILDEDQSLQLALERLVSDDRLRVQLGRSARAWWTSHHQLTTTADAYMDVIRDAIGIAVPHPMLPGHLIADGTARLRELAADLGIEDRVASLFPTRALSSTPSRG